MKAVKALAFSIRWKQAIVFLYISASVLELAARDESRGSASIPTATPPRTACCRSAPASRRSIRATARPSWVRINDRGPFVKGVTLDLTRGAAKAIGLQGTGAVCMAMM